MIVLLLLTPFDASAADITVAWDPSEDPVAGYVVYYGTSSGEYTASIDVANVSIRTIQGLSNGVRYYFVVRAYSASGYFSAPSNEVSWVAGNPLLFTDDPLMPGVHAMRAIHITELQGRINAVRLSRGLAPVVWSEAVTAGATTVKTSHIVEMRSALDAAYTVAAQPPPVYTDSPLTVSTSIKAAHITQLRAAVKALE